MKQEKVKAAALKFNLTNTDHAYVMIGTRHAELFERLIGVPDVIKTSIVEGFVTDTDRFVDRIEAKRIAVAANQLIVPIEDTYDALYSEDVW